MYQNDILHQTFIFHFSFIAILNNLFVNFNVEVDIWDTHVIYDYDLIILNDMGNLFTVLWHFEIYEYLNFLGHWKMGNILRLCTSTT
jgi:hypothetical protein